MTPSQRLWGERNLILSSPIIGWFVDQFLPGVDQEQGAIPTSRRCSPTSSECRRRCSRSAPLTRCSTTALFMEARWRAAGHATELHVWDEAPHGFLSLPMAVIRRRARRRARLPAQTARARRGRGGSRSASSSTRSRMPSFSRMLARWRSTVFLLITSSSAISPRGVPSAISLTISSSRGVSGSSRSGSPRRARSSEVAHQRASPRPGYRNGSPRIVARQASTRSRSATRLEHVAGRAGLERLEQVLLVVVHREDQDAQLGRAAVKLARRLQPGHARHRDVEDREVDVVGQRPRSTASAPSPASATTSQVGLARRARAAGRGGRPRGRRRAGSGS